MQVGDLIAVRIIGCKHLGEMTATVERITPGAVYFRYSPDAPVFAGLRGLLRVNAQAKEAGR